MIRIPPDRVTSVLRSLFRTDEPQACRCFGVLDGNGHPGKIITDDPENPASAAVARKLGYRIEKVYQCLAWGKLE